MTAYATLIYAHEYFETRLHSQIWDASSVEDRQKSLYTATRHIDRLNFAGEKAAAYTYRENLNTCVYTAAQEKAIREAGLAQELEFPRGSDSEIPEAVKIACCELALSLLDGKDAERELEDLSTISEGFSSVRTTKDRSFVPEHLHAGIVSVLAWQYLKPFLRDDQGLILTRIS